MGPARPASLLLLCLSACGNPWPSAARGPAYPQPRPRAASAASAASPLSTSSTRQASGTSALAPSAAASPARASVSAFGSAPFASADPTLLEHAASDGRWVAVCRAGTDDQGKEMQQRTLLAPGAELAIDAWLGATPDDRFVLLQQSGALVLWDSAKQSSIDLSGLGADGRLSSETNRTLRGLDFDAKSERLLYVRRGPSGSRVVIRTLSDGSERELDPGPGEVWRARFDPGGLFVVLQMITTDRNKNGKFDFPAPLLPEPRACGDDLGHFRAWPARGDRAETVLLPLAGGAASYQPELVMPVLDALLLRDENGALLLERAGKKRLLEAADCKGRIVHADAQRELFLVGCARKKKTGRVSLELVTREGRRALDVELASVELDREMSDSPRLVALYPGSDSALFDADRKELVLLQPGDSVLATRLARALIRRGKDLLIYDADAQTEQPLVAVVDKYPDVLRALPFVFVSPVLVNMDLAEVVGTIKQRPLALSVTGRVLVGAADPDAPNWARGPLQWLTPALPTPAPTR